MNPIAILADVQAVIGVANIAIQVGEDAVPYITQAYDILFNGATLTADQRAALVAQEQALTAQLNAPSIAADAP